MENSKSIETEGHQLDITGALNIAVQSIVEGVRELKQRTNESAEVF